MHIFPQILHPSRSILLSHMLISMTPVRMTVHQWRQIMGVKTNRKVLLRSFQSCFFSHSTISASSRLFGVPDVIAKCRSCPRYSIVGGDSHVNLSCGDANMQHDQQRTYQVVVAATRDMGIGKDGKLPWRLPSDFRFFKETTMTTSDPGKKNAVIMGRKTWESIPLEYRPLPGRLNVVLTRSGRFDIPAAENVKICRSIPSALEILAGPPYSLMIETVFVIGGAQILREALNAPGCDAIHMTEIESSIECDTFIPPLDHSVFHPWYSSFPDVENDIHYCFATYVRVKISAIESVSSRSRVNIDSSTVDALFNVENFTFLPKMIFEKHEEYMYLRLVQDIISSGNQKDDRTGTDTISKFGCLMRFNLRKSFPLLTTKIVNWRGVVGEALRFISSSTNAQVLREDINKRDTNKSIDHLDSRGLADRGEGDLGPTHGLHLGARYTNMHADHTGQGCAQFLDVIGKIRNKLKDGRIILSAWNPSDTKLMAYPPCHMFAQFYVANGELSCQMHQQSADMGLDVPFNLASYALLTYMIAHVCGLVPGDFTYGIEDAHVYKTHIKPLQQQLHRRPKPFPILKVNPQKTDIGSFVVDDFKLIGYDPHPKIEMERVL